MLKQTWNTADGWLEQIHKIEVNNHTTKATFWQYMISSESEMADYVWESIVEESKQRTGIR